VRRKVNAMTNWFYFVFDVYDYMERGHGFKSAVELARRVIRPQRSN